MRRVSAGKETGAYSTAVVASGDFVFISGHGPLRDGAWVRGTIEEETTATLESLATTIATVGCQLGDVVRCGCFLADVDEFAGFDTAYRAFFGEDYPARTTIGAALSDGIKVEIDAIARIARPGGER